MSDEQVKHTIPSLLNDIANVWEHQMVDAEVNVLREAADHIEQLTAERDELKKIINGPDENTVVASSFGEGEPFMLTPEKLQDKMDEWNKNDSYPTGYTFVMTEGIWNTLSWGVIERCKKAEAERDAALADNERLREGLAEMKQQLVEIMCKPEKMLLTPESVVKSIDTLLKEQP